MGMMSPAPMSASNMPVMRTPLIGFGEAAAEDGRKYWTAASTKTMAFDATSGNSAASIAYLSVLLRSLSAAASMRMFCGGALPVAGRRGQAERIWAAPIGNSG